MRLGRWTPTIVAALLAQTAPGHGQEGRAGNTEKPGWWAAGGAALHVGSSAGTFLGGRTLGAAAGVGRWELRASASRYSTFACGDCSSGLHRLTELAVIRRFATDPTRGLYAGGGVGVSHSTPVAGLTAGAAVPIGRRLRLQAEARTHRALAGATYAGADGVVRDWPPVRQTTIGLGLWAVTGSR